MKKCVIIMNPESGKKKKIKNYKDFYDILRKYGYDTDIIFTKARGDARNIMQAIDKNTDLVISGGGDGTLNEIVSGNMLREKKLTVAPLPMGSTNDVGNMYGLDKSVYSNLEKLLQGKARKVDICYIDETPFVYVACLGDYIDMAYATPRSLKKRYGKIAYIIYGLKRLKNRINQYDIKYTIDGKTHQGTYSFIFISNSSRIAGQPDVYYDVKLDDKMFEVAFANIKTKADMLKMIVQVSTMDVKDIPKVKYYRTDNLEIEFLNSPKTSWCIDGEEYKSTSMKFKFTVEQSMKMLVPKEDVGHLFDE
ncbi:MAG: diacylglycerol kinase family lipid kinase [Bacilli bacterium]|nr:diacylglycerol kinase family lipid kinase [Bacilli bacterium]